PHDLHPYIPSFPTRRSSDLATLLRGLENLATDDPATLTYDGSVEDVYFTMEHRLAEACEIAPAELDVQMARSRNDLDQGIFRMRSEEHTSELQSRENLVCRL